MRRALLAALAAALAVAIAAALATPGSDRYLVRAVFDSAGFLVPGEDVRVAGARVGSVEAVEISEPGETITRRGGRGREAAGTAIVVMEITDPGFQDFRADASCLIRPQSLLGERYVECSPTRPADRRSAIRPPLETVPEGEPGAGQLLLPIEQNGKAVDLDLVTNVMREPEVDRFRLILNELGAGLAARGPDLDAVVRRANPALAELDRTLALLADERRQLARLARDAGAALGPLARERRAVSRLIDKAGRVSEVAAARRPDLERGIKRLPGALRELRGAASALERLAVEGTPLARNLNEAAPGLDSMLARVPALAEAGTGALVSLGEQGAAATPDLLAAEPGIARLGRAARASAPGARSLDRLLTSLRSNGGFEHLLELVYNASGAFNGYDELGHFLRAELLVSNCVDYVTAPLSGCGANFTGPARASSEQTVRANARPLLDYLVGPKRGRR